ncbi:ABC transporter permease subunit [Gimesia panareensis]|uniref:ABC-2 family transporter protein n=1 Tax=Gimesia panareensis TaxID=2527978 RepID=A0A518A792_9PLAN|nr:ABC transporter permease subunit [Gimesia panareensis]QDU50593.1 ABC-2 family transporter protein [Gimesia panareensis]QDV16137.1 ABC-2 family transporter protein [Gimesia panareensis]
MFQGTFALFHRALGVDFRLTRTHLFRFMFALMILFCLFTAHASSTMMGAAGLTLFTQIVYLNFMFILIGGISFFATAITEEKEEQTIGLLLMAGVNPVSLLLGKMLPRLVAALLLLSVQFPFTLLAITLGGVMLSQVIAAYAALAAFLFFVANLGLFCSVISARSRTASTLVLIGLATYFLGVPLLQMLLTYLVKEGWLVGRASRFAVAGHLLQWLYDSSIITQINSILITGFNKTAWGYQFWSNLGFGLFLFGCANLLFTRNALNERAASPERRLIAKKRNHLFSPGRAWKQALMWKDFFFVNGGYSMGLIKLLAYGIALFSLCAFISYTTNTRTFTIQEIGMTMFWTMLIVILIEISLISARVFHVERQWNTLVSTAMLPHSMAYVAYSKVLGCLLSVLPAFFYLILGISFSIREMTYDSTLVFAEPGFWLLCVQILFFWHLTAYMSLFIKWGALPLALIIMFVGNAFYFTATNLLLLAVRMNPTEGLNIALAVIQLACIIIFHFLIKDRLIQLASE